MKHKFKAALLKVDVFLSKFVRYGGGALVWSTSALLICRCFSRFMIVNGVSTDAVYGVWDRWVDLPISDPEKIAVMVLSFVGMFLALACYDGLVGLAVGLCDFVRFVCSKFRSRKDRC